MKRTLIALIFTNVLTICLANEVINGRVINTLSRQPIAKVWVESPLQKVQTDADGKFSIEVTQLGDSLIFKHRNYKSKYYVANKNSIEVYLSQVHNQLSEVKVYEERVQPLEIFGSISVQTAKSAKMQPGIIPPMHYLADLETESYNERTENGYQVVRSNPLSTFSVDVDNASYSNIRRYLNNGNLPPVDAVKVEEMINYFSYHYPTPEKNEPFGVYQKLGECPWNADHQLLMIGLQAPKIETKDLPNSNFVFLVDVSGSMNATNKLPLLKSSLRMLVKELRPTDRVAIVTYAGSAGIALESTPGNQKQEILQAIEDMRAGGSTAGAAGLQMAYEMAEKHFITGGNNRIILATDGDFNVGPTSKSDMKNLVEQNRDKGIFLSVLGYGMGNYKDDRMETLAQNGNGNHAYIDNLQEARKVLVNEMSGNLFTVAKDVKLQLEFNPEHVYAYRLIGYENRLLNDADFNDDKKDAGEVGAGHEVTALYEIVPLSAADKFDGNVDPLKYQQNRSSKKYNEELATLKIRYKKPDGISSSKTEVRISSQVSKQSDDNYQFASAVAMFGMTLNQSEYLTNCDYDAIKKLALSGKGSDEYGYRGEFIRLVELAESLQPMQDEANQRKVKPVWVQKVKK